MSASLANGRVSHLGVNLEAASHSIDTIADIAEDRHRLITLGHIVIMNET